MYKTLQLIALTPLGEKCNNLMMSEWNDMSFVKRFALKKSGMNYSSLTPRQVDITLTFPTSMSSAYLQANFNKAFEKQISGIKKEYLSYGAVEGVDYELKIV